MARRLLPLVAVIAASCSGTPTSTTAAALTSLPPPSPAVTTAAPVMTVGPTTTLAPTTTSAPSTTTTTPPEPLQGLTLDVLGTDFGRPTFVTHAPGDDRLYITDRSGIVTAVTPDGTRTVFLDLTDVVTANGIEQGLLGLAFHPDYASNRRLFVYYTDAEPNSHLAEVTADATGAAADPATLRELIAFDQFGDRHYAGMIQFGPDGYLYVATGDGAKASENGRFPHTLLAAILRLDVDTGDPYGIPPDNPFADGVDGAPEVWAFGVRNPWRTWIDHETAVLYIADVGQERYEEVNAVPLDPVGYDFGWHAMEGTHCFTDECDTNDPVLPVVEYPHDDGCSVTGGVVYQGTAIPELRGHYLYSDWCRGWIRSFRFDAGDAVDAADWSDGFPGLTQVNSFGVGPDGEVYLVTWEGTVGKIVPVR